MNKKKVALLVCLLFVFGMCLAGCGSKSEDVVEEKTAEEIAAESVNGRFKVIGSCYETPLDIVLYYDTFTKWVYQSIDSGDEGGTLPLLSNDGTTPAKYNPETGEIEY